MRPTTLPGSYPFPEFVKVCRIISVTILTVVYTLRTGVQRMDLRRLHTDLGSSSTIVQVIGINEELVSRHYCNPLTSLFHPVRNKIRTWKSGYILRTHNGRTYDT